jgi:ribosomal protein S27E
MTTTSQPETVAPTPKPHPVDCPTCGYPMAAHNDDATVCFCSACALWHHLPTGGIR